jgi:hypothetical protein
MGLETMAIAGLASSATQMAGAGMSFAQAMQQKKRMEEAEREAAKAIAEAKDLIGVNYLAGLSIAKEPYELQREAMTMAAAQAIEAAREAGDRGIGVLPAIYQQSQIGQQKVRADMSAQMQELERLKAAEDASISTNLAKISMAEAIGAQKAAAYAENARNQALQQAGMQVAGSMKGVLGSLPQGFDLPTGDLDTLNVFRSLPQGFDLLTGDLATLGNQPGLTVPQMGDTSVLTTQPEISLPSSGSYLADPFYSYGFFTEPPKR